MMSRCRQDEVELTSISQELKLIRDILDKRGIEIAQDRFRITKLEGMVKELTENLVNLLTKDEFRSCREEMEYMVTEALDDIRNIYKELAEVSETSLSALDQSGAVGAELEEFGKTVYREMGYTGEAGAEAFKDVQELRKVIAEQDKRIKELERVIEAFMGR